jgi:predicted RNA-binding Zn ribbon-like protein
VPLDFVNTVGHRRGERRDDLETPEDLRAWARQAGLAKPGKLTLVSASHLATFRAVREDLYAVFAALARHQAPPRRSLEAFNTRIRELAVKRALRFRAGHLEWTWRGRPRDPDQLLARILDDATELLVSGLVVRVRQCRDDTCGWLFLDRSHAQRRRWCSMADCGNRSKARRHSKRHRARRVARGPR